MAKISAIARSLRRAPERVGEAVPVSGRVVNRLPVRNSTGYVLIGVVALAVLAEWVVLPVVM